MTAKSVITVVCSRCEFMTGPLNVNILHLQYKIIGQFAQKSALKNKFEIEWT